MKTRRFHAKSKSENNNLATFSRTANFDAALAEPEVEGDEGFDGEYEDLTPEEEEEGDDIIEQLALEGDIEALEDILGTVENSLLDDVEEGILTEEEAEDLYESEREYLEALLDEVANLEDVPEDEIVYDNDDDEDELDEDELDEIEAEGAEILEQLSPEELDEVVDAVIAELEDDCDAVDEMLETGEITEEEADELFNVIALQYQGIEQDYYTLMGGYEEGDEDYYDDPIVDAVGALEEEVLYQRRQNERLQAEFSQSRTAQDVSDALDGLERQASDLVQMGIMPYAVFEREFGSWESERDRFAGFSMCCEQNGTDYASELAHKQRTIEMFAEFAEGGTPLYSPQMLSHEAEFSAAELTEMEAVQVQARRNVQHMLNRR